VAAANPGFIYLSNDYGLNWSSIAYPKNWGAVSMSYDGQKIFAGDGGSGGYLYKSLDGGVTWQKILNSAFIQWKSITSSSDGTKLAAVGASNSNIYMSLDSGNNWVQHSGGPSSSWTSVKMSQSGERTVVTGSSKNVYTYYNLLPEAQSVSVTY
jgi:photosystem II stability/assembly factor-like uncharacterized protein